MPVENSKPRGLQAPIALDELDLNFHVRLEVVSCFAKVNTDKKTEQNGL